MNVLEIYGNKEIMKKALNEGYEEVAYGVGPWIKDLRIVSMFAFYKKSGEVMTYEHRKFFDDMFSHTVRANPITNYYSEELFNKFVEDFKINLSGKSELSDLLKEDKKVQK